MPGVFGGTRVMEDRGMTADRGTAAAQTAAAQDIATSLMPGHEDALRRMFNEMGAQAPRIVWSPAPDDLASPVLRRFAETCEAWMDDTGHVPSERFDTEALGALKDWLMIVEPENGDFRYTYYGARIADHYGRDMTGQRVRDFGGHISLFFEGLYLAAQSRREWVMSEHEPPKSVFVRAWRRLIVPLFGSDGDAVARFAVLNLPENELRAGLDLVPDPVFVADAERLEADNLVKDA